MLSFCVYKHTSVRVIFCLSKTKHTKILKVFKNSVDNIWHELDKCIRKNNISNISNLKKTLLGTWYNISVDVTKKLISLMLRRIQAVLDVKGGSTKY